jgi:hypothetical protein
MTKRNELQAKNRRIAMGLLIFFLVATALAVVFVLLRRAGIA